jgi:hypothetical protein
MDTVMRRSRFLPYALLLFAVVSLPVAARTSPLSNAGEDPATCPDVGAAADDQADPANKSAPAKRAAAPAVNKAHPAVRGNDATPGRAPRWHRFLPGMYR